ncbi:MAG: thioredoxin [Candidatus Magasanikbacteria bacterium]|nr:thioredoxin [Candidatus Magasanikbacteria bacterium]|tara:strand:- start:415 stop:738 length:324 start_codon:yes stop_codon:yes gene_type:complete
MAEIILSEENFDAEVLKSPIPVLVDFWAPWCGPCQMVGPIIQQLAEEMDSAKIKIAKINVDEGQAIAGKCEVLSIPTFIIFKEGKEVERLTGSLQKEQLQEFIQKHS